MFANARRGPERLTLQRFLLCDVNCGCLDGQLPSSTPVAAIYPGNH